MTSPLDIHVDLLLSTGRESVTGLSDVLASEPITITRARPAEGSQSVPTRAAMTLDNGDGRYSPRNPLSPLYGLIGRNTQAQVYLGTPHLGAAGGTATPSTSHVAPSVTATSSGMLFSSWMSDDPLTYTLPGGMTGLAGTSGAYSSMRVGRQAVSAGATGTRTATASASQGYASVSAVIHGASAGVEESLSGLSTTLEDVTLTTDATTETGWWLVAVQGWIRGFDVPMPDAPAGDDGGWILLADSGRITGSNTGPPAQTVYLRQRIWARRVNTAGAQDVIFLGAAGGASADNHAVLYVLSGVDDWDIRATVEIPSWPSRWDISGSHVWVPVDGSGIIRRLQQGSTPLHSPLRRALTGAAATVHAGRSLLPVAYWPLEDGTGSTVAASGLAGGANLVPDGTIQWASVEVTGSAPGPDWSAATGNLVGPITGVTTSQGWGIGCLVQYTGATSWDALRITVDGGKYADLRLNLGTTATLSATTSSGTSTLTSALSTINDGEPHWIEIWCVTPFGVPLQHVLRIDGSAEGVLGETGERGVPIAARVQRRGADEAGLLHLGVWAVDLPADPVSSIYSRLIAPAMTAHAGEAAGRRVERLCQEEGVAIHIVGDPDDSTPMGEQPIGSLLTLLRECEEADLGILYEPREALGLAYRTRTSRYNQPYVLELTYGATAEVADPLEPADDDRYTRNDVTVTRSGGSSYRYEVDSGPLSTQDPPNGVGRYDHATTVNVYSDALLPDQASARAHLGTVDEIRYPTVLVDLAALVDAGKDDLARAAAALGPGDRMTIASPPAWLPPGEIDQHVDGLVETLGTFIRTVSAVCVPATPWTVGVVEDEVLGRADTDGSELGADFDAGTDTSMSVAITAGPLWITTAGQPSMFPFDIVCGGVVLEVTGISGGSSPQTFTITQSPVNGVERTIPAGTALSLAHPWRLAL